MQSCNNCHGSGRIGTPVTDENGNTLIVVSTCSTCGGTGWQSGGSAS